MSFLAWVMFGLIAGVIANLLDPYPSKGGLLGAIVLGILGASLGSILGSLMLGTSVTGFNLSSFLIAVGGSLLLLAIPRLLGRV